MQFLRWHPSSQNRQVVNTLHNSDKQQPFAHHRFLVRSQFRFWLRFLCVLLIFAFTASIVDLLDTQPVRAESNEATAIHATFATEYAVPNGPRQLVEEAPGRIWYTATDAGGIGFLEIISSPDEPFVRYHTEFYGLGALSQPYDLVYSEGVVWFTLRGVRSLGRIDVATREIKVYPLLTVGAAPTGIDVGNDGRLWIAQNNGRISTFDPVTESFEEYVFPVSLAQKPRIEDIVFQNTRNIWFTMPDANLVVAYDTVRDRFIELPTGFLQPMYLNFGPDGSLWVTSAGSSRIGRYTPNSTVSIWQWYQPPTPESSPVGIVVFDDDQNVLQVWVTENGTGTLGRMQIVNNFEVVARERLGPATPTGTPWGIIHSSNGSLWVADTSRNLIYEVKAPYIRRTYLSVVEKNEQ